MGQRLTDECVDAAVERALKKFDRAGEKFRRGLVTENECRRVLMEEFYTVFMGFFRENDIELELNETSYVQFAREFRAYKEGDDLSNPDHMPWLYDRTEEPCEAAANDQRQFFRLMERFHLLPEYFEPVPEGVPAPDIIPIHQYHSAGVYGTHFNCIDDGGLLADSDPAGKTFRLKNDLGLEAAVTIKEDRRRGDRNGMDFDEVVSSSNRGVVVALAEFLAEGCIEGYTAKERKCDPEILIRLNNSGENVCWLAYWRDPHDEEACRGCSMWQKYFDWAAEKERRQEEMLSCLFDAYLTQ